MDEGWWGIELNGDSSFVLSIVGEECSSRWRVHEGILKINWRTVASWSDQYLAVNK